MLALFLFPFALSEADLINNAVNRKYQIQDDLIIVTVTAKVYNQGTSCSSYTFTIPERENEHIGHTTASFTSNNIRSFDKSLPISVNGNEYTVDLKKSIPTGEEFTLYFSYTLGDYLLFTKQKVALNQRIQLYFNTTKFFKSKYQTKKSSLSIVGIPRSSITTPKHVLEDSGVRMQSSMIILNDLTSDDGSDFEIEFTTSHPMLRVDKIISQTSVSHWGKTKQKAFYSITNAGPKFTGEFNRIDFNPRTTPCFTQSIEMRPPEGARNFWASDESGLLQKELHLTGNDLLIPLRGPMLSSWKATFTAGWTVDTSVFVSGGYRFKAPLIPKSVSAPVTEVVAEFVLPEGVEVVDVQVPIDANVTKFIEPHNLDLNGRTVVRIETNHLSTEDDVPIIIDYKLGSYYHFLKILTLSVAFTIVFVAIIVARRFDCSISNNKEKSE
ncbi:dolichyl-diphosphooligosaccharide--protein glycosyltransferase subunit 1A [Histomonas meleagridis]|uniref:dolichyl-diphosphooligosaccharide--protein glycosyltransferase subunit 1A n=1 Tax=Histomonas meleagridis TaxID=135588 RepID=UPI00355A494B|nr:dolichyl-diphosphooligosaccharide--protein glycosyltransferase subunit 1A [Histomonas meleagridis]KAH0803702.1 dolichyl-diphosphooligosaccharide--protein glycosyltransferase subunit 1A [Histomonas meleagridis]